MQLPKVDAALIERNKIVGYLLNPQHPEGASKARFFNSLGFRVAEWQKLADTLRQVALASPVTMTMETVHGRKYIIDGVLTSPTGRSASVRTVWIIDEGSELPRLVSAFPH